MFQPRFFIAVNAVPILFLIQPGLALLCSTVSLGEFVEPFLEAIFKLFEAARLVPKFLDMLLEERGRRLGAAKPHKRIITPVSAESKLFHNCWLYNKTGFFVGAPSPSCPTPPCPSRRARVGGW